MRAFLCLLLLAPLVAGYLPVVLWHGMGDSCCNPLSMGRISKLVSDTHNGTYVHSIMTGANVFADTAEGFFANMNDQLDTVCGKIKADPKLSGGFHAMGFSQGGQFLRALQQRCPAIAMQNLVTFGGQHQGVFGLPKCEGSGIIGSLCEKARQLIDTGAYEYYVQRAVVQAQYWHDPLNEQEYRNSSIFLADINQENVVVPSYRDNLANLTNLVLVKFLQDTMVIPRESAWFGFYTPGQDKEITNLQNSTLYTEDRLGLKALDLAGRLHFLSIDADHLQVSDAWMVEHVINAFLD